MKIVHSFAQFCIVFHIVCKKLACYTKSVKTDDCKFIIHISFIILIEREGVTALPFVMR